MNGGTKVDGAFPGGAGNDWTLVGAQDFNGDGKSDLLWRHNDGTVLIWFIDGGAKVGDASPGAESNDWKIQGTAAN
jgi:hypothetical protein